MNYIAANTSPAENDFDNVYKKIYTHFYIVWMVDSFFPPPKHKLYFSPAFTFQVYGAN